MNEVKAQMEEEIDKFEQELSQGEELNGQRIYKLLAEVIEDRLHLPRECRCCQKGKGLLLLEELVQGCWVLGFR